MEQLVLIAPFTHYYAFEPDSREARKLSGTLNSGNPWQNVTVISDAVSSYEGKATLHITQQPGLSSILEPNYDVINRYYADPVFRIESTVEVPTISLDHAAERNAFQDACFLKVDTQGTELDILKSGQTLLENSVLGVYVEVAFHRFYVHQPLFSDVDAYLHKLGFSLFDLHRVLIRRGSHQSDLYSRRQVVWAHALYMREPQSVLQGADDEMLSKSARLLGLALAFEHFDVALELTSSRRFAKLTADNYGFQIREDVEEFVRHRTGVLLDKFHVDGSLPNCTTSVYKDRKHILSHEHYQLLQKYALRNRQYKELVQKHKKLEQSKAIRVAKKLSKYPSLAKSLSTGYDLLARLYGFFRRTRDHFERSKSTA